MKEVGGGGAPAGSGPRGHMRMIKVGLTGNALAHGEACLDFSHLQGHLAASRNVPFSFRFSDWA